MSYSEELAVRVREALVDRKSVREVRMFQGLCFMVDDKMCICLRDDRLMCRVGPDAYAEAVERNGAAPMIHGKRQMKGFVFVEPAGYKIKEDFEYWVKLCLEYSDTVKPARRR